MELEEIKEHLANNEDNIPLSFTDLVYNSNKQITIQGKCVYSLKYKDSDYSIFKFYKPISRFKNDE